jgi:hypothetical protein
MSADWCFVQNYYKRKPENDKGPKELKYGEVTLAHTSPFLGTMTPGQTIQVRSREYVPAISGSRPFLTRLFSLSTNVGCDHDYLLIVLCPRVRSRLNSVVNPLYVLILEIFWVNLKRIAIVSDSWVKRRLTDCPLKAFL